MFALFFTFLSPNKQPTVLSPPHTIAKGQLVYLSRNSRLTMPPQARKAVTSPLSQATTTELHRQSFPMPYIASPHRTPQSSPNRQASAGRSLLD